MKVCCVEERALGRREPCGVLYVGGGGGAYEGGGGGE